MSDIVALVDAGEEAPKPLRLIVSAVFMNPRTTNQSWYAAKLRFVILLETNGSEDASDSIYLLRSNSFEAAFARALEIGRAAESEYLWGTGERVRWRLKEIVTLDVLQAAELDGIEVHSQFMPLGDDEFYGFDHVFQPEFSKPHHTGVT